MSNKDITRRFYDEVVNQGKLELIDELLDPSFVEHEELPGLSGGRDGVKEFMGMMRSAFPDLTFSAEEMIEAGDKVIVRGTMRGTHQGEFMGVPASGKQIDVSFIDIVRFANGKATEHWGVTDMLTMMQQVGAVPAPA